MMKKKKTALLAWLGLNDTPKRKPRRSKNKGGMKNSKSSAGRRYVAKYMQAGKLAYEYRTSKKHLRYVVVASFTPRGPRKVRGWFATKADAERLMARKGSEWSKISCVKVRVAKGNGVKSTPTVARKNS